MTACGRLIPRACGAPGCPNRAGLGKRIRYVTTSLAESWPNPHLLTCPLSAAVGAEPATRRVPQLRPRLDEVDERTQRCGYEAWSGVVEERPREAQPPRLEHGLEI